MSYYQENWKWTMQGVQNFSGELATVFFQVTSGIGFSKEPEKACLELDKGLASLKDIRLRLGYFPEEVIELVAFIEIRPAEHVAEGYPSGQEPPQIPWERETEWLLTVVDRAAEFLEWQTKELQKGRSPFNREKVIANIHDERQDVLDAFGEFYGKMNTTNAWAALQRQTDLPGPDLPSEPEGWHF